MRFGAETRVLFVGDSTVFRLTRNYTFWNDLEKRYAAMYFSVPTFTTENIIHLLSSTSHVKDITSNEPLVFLSAGNANVELGQSLLLIYLDVDQDTILFIDSYLLIICVHRG